MSFIELVNDYWGIGAVILGGLGYFFTHKKASIAYAKKVASDAILSAERKAEDLALNTGEEKFSWVVDKGYSYLPPIVKTFVSKELFAVLVQAVFDKAKKFAKDHHH